MNDRSIFLCRTDLCNWSGYVRDVLVRDGLMECPCCGQRLWSASGRPKIKPLAIGVNPVVWWQGRIEQPASIQSVPCSFEDKLAAITCE